jgi:hypothetical protein
MTNELVIEAVWGQGEGMVQGEITPDKYIVDTNKGEGVLREIKLIHSYTHTPMHLYTHTLIRPYTHTPIHSYTHIPIHPYTHTLIHS